MAKEVKSLRLFEGFDPLALAAMEAALPPGEVFLLSPLPWRTPVAESRERAQKEVALGVTTEGVYEFTLDRSGTSVTSDLRTALTRVEQVGLAEKVRWFNSRAYFSRRVAEKVVVLTFHVGGVLADFWTPFAQGVEFARALQRSAGSASSGELGGPAGQLEILHALVEKGAISPDEWQRAKQLFLGQAPSRQSEALIQLSQLFSLHQAGALDDAEFKIKKWNLLAKN